MSPLLGRPTLEGSALTGRALLLLVAVLLAAAPITQLLAGSSWFLIAMTCAMPVILGGLVLRHLLRRTLLVPVLQLVLIVVLLLVVETFVGVAPWSEGPLAVIAAQQEVFRLGVRELASGVAPLLLGPEGTVLAVAIGALVVLVLDMMFLDLGWHTPTGLALMGSLLIPSLQQPAGGPWWQVVLPVAAGAAILATRTVHGDPRYLEGDRRPQAGPLHRPWRTLGAAALSVALVAGLTPLLAPALPQLVEPRVALNVELLNRWQDPDAPALGPVMVDDSVSVRRALLEQSDTEVLRYTTTSTDPSYLRLRTLNSFDGETFRATASGEGVDLGLDAFSTARDDGRTLGDASADVTRMQIQSYAGDRLPVPENLRRLDADDPALQDALSLDPVSGEARTGAAAMGLVGQQYEILSEPTAATPDQLRAVPAAQLRAPFETGYTSSDEVPQVAADLAEEVAANAGADNAFDTALAYQDYFRNTFAYSLTVTTPPGADPLESFLEDRIGYCEQFASAFALMMISQGYPTRVVIGFTAGDVDGEERTVTARNAHAWPEVWFGPEHGWVQFEPTPAAAANGVRTPAVTDATAGADDVEAPTDAPTTEAPSDSPSSTEEGTTEEQSSAEAQASDAGGVSTGTVRRVEFGAFTVLGLGVLVTAAAAATVLMIRRRRVTAREERWAALAEGVGGGAADGGGADGGAADGGGAPAPGGRGGAPADPYSAERLRRRAGELAWSELERELSVRRLAIRWLGITGAWGRPPQQLTLDRTLPPHRALDDLLDQIAAGSREVTAEDRAAAGRVADAHTAAVYAARLPEAGEGAAGAVSAAPSAAPASSATTEPAASPATRPARPVHPLRHDADRLVELIRTAR